MDDAFWDGLGDDLPAMPGLDMDMDIEIPCPTAPLVEALSEAQAASEAAAQAAVEAAAWINFDYESFPE